MTKKFFLAIVAILVSGCTATRDYDECVESHRESALKPTPECAMTTDGDWDCGNLKYKLVTEEVCDVWIHHDYNESSKTWTNSTVYREGYNSTPA